jgi:hypothetical protein
LSCPGLGVMLQRRLWPKAWCCLCLALFSLLLLTQRSALAQIQLQGVSQPQTHTAALASKILTPELGLYVDSTRRMDVEDVSRQVFTPFKLLLNRSLEPTTRWLKIKVQVPVGQQSPLMLVVGPYFLSELELYHEEGGRWVKQISAKLFDRATRFCVTRLWKQSARLFFAH